MAPGVTLPASAAQAISTPEIGFPKASVTCTTSESGRGAPAAADCPSPATADIWFASDDTASNRSGANSTRSPLVVTTRTSAAAPPTRVPSTIRNAAWPSPSVMAVSGATVAPLGSPVNAKATGAPMTGRSWASVTRATTG